ncbi:hypothetical protein KQI84_03090 [bacterium]|nr:hypothetical protein [bacterium]
MPFRLIKTLLGGRRLADPEKVADLDQLIRHGADRFAEWAADQTGQEVALAPRAVEVVEKAIEIARRSSDDIPNQLVSDCAAFIGEAIRARHGGEWEEDPLLGLVLRRPEKIDGVAAVPLAIAEKKWELGEQLSIARFFETLPQRIEKERSFEAYRSGPARTTERIAEELLSETPITTATQTARDFRAFWKERFRIVLPNSLQGVREAERFLRSQFFLFGLHEETLVQMGFFVGEVGRGLFEGEWKFDELQATNDPTRAALVWPELPYYPVGKIYKLITEHPEGESLDEYLRLIPSARHALKSDPESL